MPCGDVRQVHALAIALIEEGVAALKQRGVHLRQIPTLLIVELVEGQDAVANGGNMHLQWPAGCSRNVGDPGVVAHDDALLGLELGGENVVQEVAARLLVVSLRMLQLLFELRGDEGVRVDLAVRVRERHADFLAMVLEREHLLDAFDVAQFCGTESPRFHNRADS